MRLLFFLCFVSSLCLGQRKGTIASSGKATIFDYATANYDLNTDCFDSWGVTNGTYGDYAQANQTVTTSKLFETSLNFDLNTKYVTITDSTKYLDFSNGGSDYPFSISFWLYPTTVTGVGFLVSKRDGTYAQWQVIRNADKMSITILNNNSTSNYLSVTTPASSVVINTWAHWTITYDGSKVVGGFKVYKNGVSQTLTNASAGSYTTGMVTSYCPIYIGVLAGGFTLPLTGYVNQLSIWRNKILAQSDVDYIYNSGSGRQFTHPNIYSTTKIVLAQRGYWMLATDLTSKLYWSNDGGRTWPISRNWSAQWSSTTPGATKKAGLTIDFAYIFNSGTAVWSTAKKLYRSTNQLTTVTNPSLKFANGHPFYFHTPADTTHPGAYFYHENQFVNKPAIINGTEVLIGSNYTNVAAVNLGASDVNVFYSDDDGATFKTLYRFGVNTNYKDDGTAGGGTTGTAMGDSTNAIICRHAHGTYWVQGTNSFVTITGDFAGEVNWIKHTYNSGVWTNSAPYSGGSPSNYWMANDVNSLADGSFIWGSDATSGGSTNYGLFQTTLANIGVTATQLTNPFNSTTLRPFLFYCDDNSQSYIVSNTGLGAEKYKLYLINRATNKIRYIPIINLQSVASVSSWYPRMGYRNSSGFVKIMVSGDVDVPEKTIFLRP